MKALIIGATGLVGREIVKLLLGDPTISEVVVFSRREMTLVHPKLKKLVVDFNKISDWSGELRGDILFSALGTTRKVAGSKEAQYLVDHDYQWKVAEAAVRQGVSTFVLISSAGASAKSPFFYLRMKGELEEKIKQLPFHSITVLRPGPLTGHREAPRLSEAISTKILEMLPAFLLSSNSKPVASEIVAKSAVVAGLKGTAGKHITMASEILRENVS